MLKDQILKIKSENPDFGYRKIGKLLNCSNNIVRYHLDPEVRKYYKIRRKINKRNSLTKIKMEFGGKCKKCGYSKCLDALCFHHIDPKNKTNEVSKLVRKGNYASAYREAEKCILICANCHAELHFETKDILL